MQLGSAPATVFHGRGHMPSSPFSPRWKHSLWLLDEPPKHVSSCGPFTSHTWCGEPWHGTAKHWFAKPQGRSCCRNATAPRSFLAFIGWTALVQFARHMSAKDPPPEVLREPRAEAVVIRKKRNPYIPQAGRYSSVDWVANLAGLPSSTVLWRIRSPVLCTTLAALLIYILYVVFAPAGHFVRLSLVWHSIIGSALGLLLVFRTNTAYSRFWEGRVLWEQILALGRDLTRTAVLFRKQMGPEPTARVCRLVQAFPYCMIEHLRGRADKALRAKLQLLVQDIGTHAGPLDADLVLSTNRPLFIVNRLAATITAVDNELGALAKFTNRERIWLLSKVDNLSKTIGACERLVQTPVPLSYVRHTSRFLSIFMLTLPWALVEQLGVLVVPFTCITSWALFGILEIGLLIEDPFSSVLKLDVVADTLEKDIEETLQFLNAEDLLESSGTRAAKRAAREAERIAKEAERSMTPSPSQKTEATTAAPPTGAVESKPKSKSAHLEPKEVDCIYTKAVEAFKWYEKNDDGNIDVEVVKSGLRRLRAEYWTDDRLNTLLEEADVNKDGYISYEEWTQWTGGLKATTASELARVTSMPSSAPLPADSQDDDKGVEDKEDAPEDEKQQGGGQKESKCPDDGNKDVQDERPTDVSALDDKAVTTSGDADGGVVPASSSQEAGRATDTSKNDNAGSKDLSILEEPC